MTTNSTIRINKRLQPDAMRPKKDPRNLFNLGRKKMNTNRIAAGIIFLASFLSAYRYRRRPTDPRVGKMTYEGSGLAEKAPEFGEVWFTFQVNCQTSADEVRKSIEARAQKSGRPSRRKSQLLRQMKSGKHTGEASETSSRPPALTCNRPRPIVIPAPSFLVPLSVLIFARTKESIWKKQSRRSIRESSASE